MKSAEEIIKQLQTKKKAFNKIKASYKRIGGEEPDKAIISTINRLNEDIKILEWILD